MLCSSLLRVSSFRLIRCPFTTLEQLRLAEEALREWVEPPNVSNLDAHHGPCRALWDTYLRTPSSSLLARLSWVTLGYHYQWTARTYDLAQKSPFPGRLAAIAADLASATGSVLSWAGMSALAMASPTAPGLEYPSAPEMAAAKALPSVAASAQAWAAARALASASTSGAASAPMWAFPTARLSE